MMHSPHLRQLGVLLFSVLCGVALAVPSPALACKCMFPAPEQAREAAVAVFEGRVSAIEEVAAQGDTGMATKRVTLSLVRTWKGLENKESVVVSTSASSASCGYTFEPNTSYLVYAGGSEAALDVSGCSRTRPMSDASEDLAVLGAGITPVDVKAQPATPTTPATAPKTGGCGSMSGSAKASASLLLFPVTGIALGARRRRQRVRRL